MLVVTRPHRQQREGSVKFETTAEKLTRCRTRLLLGQAFFGTLSLRLKLVPGNLPTMATDGAHIVYNPAFGDHLNPAELEGTLAHEMMHCALGHQCRRVGRDPELWNRATDFAINPILIANGLTLPAGALIDPAFSNLSRRNLCSVVTEGQRRCGTEAATTATTTEKYAKQQSRWSARNTVSGAGEFTAQRILSRTTGLRRAERLLGSDGPFMLLSAQLGLRRSSRTASRSRIGARSFGTSWRPLPPRITTGRRLIVAISPMVYTCLRWNGRESGKSSSPLTPRDRLAGLNWNGLRAKFQPSATKFNQRHFMWSIATQPCNLARPRRCGWNQKAEEARISVRCSTGSERPGSRRLALFTLRTSAVTHFRKFRNIPSCGSPIHGG
jgi:hypothetical protein